LLGEAANENEKKKSNVKMPTFSKAHAFVNDPHCKLFNNASQPVFR